MFLTKNEGITLQIFDFYKQILDGTISEFQQEEVENLLAVTVLETFTFLLNTQNVNDYSYSIHYAFEFMQYICKPNQ